MVEKAVLERVFWVSSCRNCSFTGSQREAVVCCHPEKPYQPKFGAVEDSNEHGSAPPPECPLREASVLTRVELIDGI